ncbi:MAG: ATP-binding cassette domain-containing protein [Lewinella sp.]|nr:ATP-binding cassette domain-containing protein [Lewinella sp.]
MIEVQNLRKQYGTVAAVADLSFRLSPGQTLVLAGTSGSGKTTTLKMLNRLIEPTSGRILLEGRDVLSLSPAELRRRMGYVIQQVGLFPHYKVAENVAVVPRLLGWPADRIRQRSEELLQRLDLAPADFLHRYPRELSGGQQQRVGIARALAADPPVVLMDEPFGALDPITRTALQRDFRQLENLLSKTIVLVTHDVEEAFALGDLICLLDEGRLQQLGSPSELLFQPANDFVRRFLGEQRLSLAYRILTLADALPSLPTEAPAGAPTLSLPPETSLQAAQEALLQAPDPATIGRVDQPTPRFFQLTDLTAVAERRLRQPSAA